MKTKLLIFSIIIFSLNAHAQRHRLHEKLQSEKISYLTEKLDLSVEEAQRFWPLYNEHNDKVNSLMKEKRKIAHSLKNNSEKINTNELEEKTDRLVEIRLIIAQTDKTYYEKYKKVLPVKKVALFFYYEKEFKRHLLKRYRKHGKEGIKGCPESKPSGK